MDEVRRKCAQTSKEARAKQLKMLCFLPCETAPLPLQEILNKCKITVKSIEIQEKYFTFVAKKRQKDKTKHLKDMKKLVLMSLLLVCGFSFAAAQAEIKFDKLTHNFGTFSEKEAKVSCVFTYTNVGDAPLVINQAVASCGCTVPEYTKTPVQPGESGQIKVTYNGSGKFPGHFKKSITVRTNGKVEMTRLYIEGDMTEAK